jgi:hypothetical protein
MTGGGISPVLFRLFAGERVEGDDAMMMDRTHHAGAQRDARIRAQPRPAARGRRRRQNVQLGCGGKENERLLGPDR